MAKKSRSARKASLERATRAVERGLPTAAPLVERKATPGPYATRRRGAAPGQDDAYPPKGMPTVVKVAFGALLALGLMFVLSLLRR